MTASNTLASLAVDAKISLDGESYCFGRFLDRTVRERVQNHKGTICGKAHPPNHRVKPGREIAAFSLWLDITPDIMSTLLPHMTTVNSSGNIWTSNETLTHMPVVADKVGAIHRYNETRIGRWTLRAQRGTLPASLQLDCVAKNEEQLSSFAFTKGPISSIYTFDEVGYEIGTGVAGAYASYEIDRIAIMSDLNLFKQWNNNKFMTNASLTLQNTFVATSVPYVDSTHDVYWDNKDSTASLKNRVTFTSGTDILKFEMPAGILNPKSPDIQDKLAEIRLPLTWQGHIDTSADPDTAAFNFDHLVT